MYTTLSLMAGILCKNRLNTVLAGQNQQNLQKKCANSSLHLLHTPFTPVCLFVCVCFNISNSVFKDREGNKNIVSQDIDSRVNHCSSFHSLLLTFHGFHTHRNRKKTGGQVGWMMNDKVNREELRDKIKEEWMRETENKFEKDKKNKSWNNRKKGESEW